MSPMNLPARERGEEWAWEQLEKSEYVTLAANGEDGFPYNLPLSTVRIGSALFFHTARKGTLGALLQEDSRVCVTCVTWAERNAEHTTMYFRSAMAFGRVSQVLEREEIKSVMTEFFNKYLPPSDRDRFPRYAERAAEVASVWRVDVERVYGKENI